MEIIVHDLTELDAAAAQLIQHFKDDRVFLFYGNMGAGKTTFVNAICKALGVIDSTSSPTFSIVNEYQSPVGALYHFDFYRLKTEEEALDLGYEEYFYSTQYCFVEWPEKIPNLLPTDARKVHIEVLSPTSRKIIVK
ncbi:tRNA (adenosine(37)-N6)-threonylcarbamoyltransferase complex ATPase subunit type 1 TsaE [Sphingobacterium psychroaquaticum]|uniref:tRNA threonylcarbamoyladenosine biosynthesis protein TsaE n=1 Tax=Sphingobacterium psychroaquaticum TaxID=561061 RepID=A0A1X7K2Z2_9SPHI|nr:tRNA (adenosine(37)-N6)-threonylcarbamoyltransferase complex ATPase subunit type 1 TsaE [Sphingobacterium psychroaquaticum]QBQ42595.1 tRNA (adenosine(37)-N6)-threonylcarbamoyltransferase complex ATPase subunit type 1 TsaE [Sphingobacterium psychroaquaticum]SMG35180.1 tRNA threonylcarbamoyladenosine biosynthesis protein TsaE [Sphingobacterium psychroaquaticum]